MFLAVDEFAAFEEERRHPHGIVGIDAPRKFNEGLAFRGRMNRDDFNAGHEASDFTGGGAMCKSELALQQCGNGVIASAL
jgi:hypothetical protein